MEMPKDLHVETKETHHIDQFTYAWGHENGKLGLSEYAAKCLKLEGASRIDLLEANNDTSYDFCVKEDDFFDEDVENIFDKITNYKGEVEYCLEVWSLHELLFLLASKGFLPYGNYIVGVSW